MYGWETSVQFAANEIKYFLYYQIALGSYSQYKEDLIIEKLINKPQGWYVDIGASDPLRFNNTYRFYRRGWRGINIDPNAANIRKFSIHRPEDINLNIGIDKRTNQLPFYEMWPSTLSTFSRSDKENYETQGYKFVGVTKIQVWPLAKVLDIYAKNRSIDFFSIDTEGYDLRVLESNNWRKYRPKVICIEDKGSKLDNYFKKINYKKVFGYHINSIYMAE